MKKKIGKRKKQKNQRWTFTFTVNKTILSATLRKTTTEAKKGDNRKWKRIKCIKKMASNQKVTNWQWRIFENFKESHIGIIVKWGAFLLERCCCCFFFFSVFPAAKANWRFLHRQNFITVNKDYVSPACITFRTR